MSNLTVSELAALRSLLSVERLGPQKTKALVSKFRSFEDVLSASVTALKNTDGISEELAKRIIKASKNMDEFTGSTVSLLEDLKNKNAALVTLWDDDYPYRLKNIYDPPLILYYKGTLAPEPENAVAIVGTREPTQYGRSYADRFAAELSKAGFTIVSGLARGIDSIAHRSVIKAGGRTIGVLGCGIDVIYPPENKQLYADMEKDGAIITEYPPGTKPDAVNFPRRNRIISGLSLGTLLIESGVTGGALHTARFSLDQGREIFALPGNIGSRQSEGPNLLIQKGEAKLVTKSEDVITEFSGLLKTKSDKKHQAPPEDLTLFEALIFSKLGDEPVQIDKLSEMTSLSASDCLVNLLTLEFKGLVRQLPGKNFIRM